MTDRPSHSGADPDCGLSRGAALRRLLAQPVPQVILEAHDPLSARIVEQSGLAAVWASSLTISASWGARDANELSWTQVADVLEHMADVTTVPILVDGDSGHGDFNTTRRFVRRLSRRGLAGVCFEDQCFPKSNSLLGDCHALADPVEFCGKLQAAKDAQSDDRFVVVARVEALIAGMGMDEALRRAEAYHGAGADAILIHSRLPDPSQVLQFASEWGGRSPLLIVPTTYSATPISTYANAGISAVIWANHILRAAVAAMRYLCEVVRQDHSPRAVESTIARIQDLFDLTDQEELLAARARYGGSGATAQAASLAQGRQTAVPSVALPRC